MAEVSQREWKTPGQRRAKRKAWGYTVTVPCSPCPHRDKKEPTKVLHPKGVRREKGYRAEWTRDDAEKALAAVQLQIETAPKAQASGITLGEACDKYLVTTTNRGNPRSAEDRRIIKHLKEVFGADSPLSAVTAARISAYRDGRLGSKSERTDRQVKAATVNRPLAVLRHILRLAHDEWELLAAVPKIRLAKEPQGRERWFAVEEEARLLAACAKSQNKNLLAIVTVALESGLRKGELLGLTWDRVDMTRGMLKLEETKSGRRREVPMRQAVYDTLAGRPGARERRVWPVGSIRTAFENAVADAKLDLPFHFHGPVWWQAWRDRAATSRGSPSTWTRPSSRASVWRSLRSWCRRSHASPCSGTPPTARRVSGSRGRRSRAASWGSPSSPRA
jgi:integrase